MTHFRMIPALALTIGIMTTGCGSEKSALQLPKLITDNMVLQQKSEASIWGKAAPGSKINLTASWGEKTSATTLPDSTWLLKLKTPEAGGPFTINIQNSDSLHTIQNVMSGEVWLASGQSNMEMPLAGWPPNDTIQYSASEIEAANYTGIRMFTVAKNISVTPLDDVSGQWAVCTPQSAPTFSASAFFFAKKLHQTLNIPVGIIHSSWGGTPAEAWVEGKVLAASPDFSATIAKLDSIAPQSKAFEAWLKGFNTIDVATRPDGSDPIVGLDLFDSVCSNPALDDADWNTMTIPTTIENTEVGEFDGTIWFRRSIDIPAQWNGKALTLTLGAIDDRDVTYFNGIRVGANDAAGLWQMNREYTIPAEITKTGKAVIAVKMTDTQGGGGLSGKPELMAISLQNAPKQTIALTGEWKYRVVALYKQNQMTIFDPVKNEFANRPQLSIQLGSGTPSALYNAMIAPLTPYTIKGAIWYQGETNVGRANQYVKLMSDLISNWRTRFNQPDMPFYFTQLAPWNYSDVNGTSSANLREAQRRTMTIPNTGMISTLDIGNVNNIHPCHKKEVGERLAAWALTNQYGQQMASSGPLFSNIEIKDNSAILHFTHTNDGLLLKNEIPNQFEIAGNNGVFYPAITTIEGETIVCRSPKVTAPVSVRYAFRNGAQASLFNNAGLPAPSFTTESEFGN